MGEGKQAMRSRGNGKHGGSAGAVVTARRRAEQGHLLVGLVVLIAVMLIMLTAAAQSWTFLVRRDREAELIQRGEEYARAIAFYHKENQAWPLKLDLLVEKGPHGHRFIRKLYPDPLAEDGEWGLLYLSPTGKGFINPYATQLGADPFLADPFGQQPVDTGFGKKRRSGNAFQRHPSSGEGSGSPGYSEINPQQLKSMGNPSLPIVGVVHKTPEYGVKIYKGQASLNDWAFTLMAEGQEHNQGSGGHRPQTRSRRPMGIGDHTSPIFLPGMLPPPPNAGTSHVQKEMIEERKRQEEEEERLRQEEEERRRRLLEEAGIDPDDPHGENEGEEGEGDEDDGLDEEDPDGEESDDDPPDDEDPNAP